MSVHLQFYKITASPVYDLIVKREQLISTVEKQLNEWAQSHGAISCQMFGKFLTRTDIFAVLFDGTPPVGGGWKKHPKQSRLPKFPEGSLYAPCKSAKGKALQGELDLLTATIREKPAELLDILTIDPYASVLQHNPQTRRISTYSPAMGRADADTVILIVPIKWDLENGELPKLPIPEGIEGVKPIEKGEYLKILQEAKAVEAAKAGSEVSG